MVKRIAILGVILCLLAGCNRGSVKLSPVIEGQAAPHAGWNFGPDSYLRAGDPAKVSGIVLDIDGLDPNDIFGTR